MTWEKTGKTVNTDGSSVITYLPMSGSNYFRTDLRIERRKQVVEYANREEVWYHTTYFVVSGDNEREYWSLKDAKLAAEKKLGVMKT